ncbi:toll-like receptor 5 [Lates japonicus]|uniref:Toll-like receptor 5 n=1 Tax=Lates japonicus TaxID=270547 RepID=A0AAD3R970_LATJO|nr:toll-like receptor 5 [Lates japonicus]
MQISQQENNRTGVMLEEIRQHADCATMWGKSNSDYGWVEAALLNKLDNQFSEENIFHCCFEARDFLPGEDHLSNIREAIWGSRKTVCIISKEFLKDGWCLEAFALAHFRMLEELTNILIMLVIGKVAHY